MHTEMEAANEQRQALQNEYTEAGTLCTSLVVMLLCTTRAI
jgi:hypothetical protein|eukprot:COSAG01_NODE_27864_length_674_cov_1184.394783_2_plen_41_part_00